MNNIGSRLKSLLDKRGLSPYKVSQRTGVSQSTLSRIINYNSTPNESNLKALVDFFNVDETWFLTGKKREANQVGESASKHSKDIGVIDENRKAEFEQILDQVSVEEIINYIYKHESRFNNSEAYRRFVKILNQRAIIEYLQNELKSEKKNEKKEL